MIDRRHLIQKHNVKLYDIDYKSPLSVGNGNFVFGADITGIQSLYHDYEESFPLCTMSNFGWHSEYNGERPYSLEDLELTEYHCRDKDFYYPVKKTEQNGQAYDWLRQNSHKVNLYRLGYMFEDKEIGPKQLSDIRQELDLYSGILESSFMLQGHQVQTKTVCRAENNGLGVQVVLDEGLIGHLSLELGFSYGSPEISGADWNHPEKHESNIMCVGEDLYLINRVMDDLIYQVLISIDGAKLYQNSEQTFSISPTKSRIEIVLVTDQVVPRKKQSFSNILKSSMEFWMEFWNSIGLIDFSQTDDMRAEELERREILSLYLTRLQCAGSLPPAETGLSCNSWYGKFHLEMHFWHSGFLPLYSKGILLENSIIWYLEHLEDARDNARRNQYQGVRWPKMVGLEGKDSPSPIAPLLIWQQPHIIFMLELLYQSQKEQRVILQYWKLIKESADFMVDFVEWNEEKQVYELGSPLIPVQETHNPMTAFNPVFELEYWRETLAIACKWAKRAGQEVNTAWREVGEHMAHPAVKDGVYLAHEGAENTYIKHAKDHPSMLMAFGMLRGNDIQPDIMEKTLEKVLCSWDFDTTWGWDFAVMAMTATRLGKPELAVDLLLKDTQKNEYIVNGHNRQGYRKDLPLYLPGNGSFLYALGMMAAGFEGCKRTHPGLPSEWKVEYEGINVFY